MVGAGYTSGWRYSRLGLLTFFLIVFGGGVAHAFRVEAGRSEAAERAPTARPRAPIFAADQQEAAKAAHTAGVSIRWNDRLGTPHSVRGKGLGRRQAFSGGKAGGAPANAGAERKAKAALDNLSRIYRFKDVEQEFQVRRVQDDKLGHQHVRLTQRHRGVPVVGGELVVHLDAQGEVYEVNGSYVAGIQVEVLPKLTGARAAALAKANLLARGLPPGTVAGNPELVVFALESAPRLAYQLTVRSDAKAPPGRWRYWVDAAEGTLLLCYNDIQRIDPPTGNGTSASVTGSLLTGEGGGSTNVVGWFENTGNYYLYNKSLHWYVYNVASSGYPDASTYAYRSTSDWGTSDRAELSLASGFDWVQRYWLDIHGRHSFDDANSEARANAHEGVSYVNAYWDGSDFHFGDGDGVSANSLAVLDIAGHEYAHAVTEHSANLVYAYESGALNESFSDIFGACVEFYAQPDGRALYPGKAAGTADWLCGEDAWLVSTALRDLRSPTNTATVGAGNEQPSRYHGTYWYHGSDDNGGVHDNSGVQNFCFYLLSEGGSGDNDGIAYSVTGIGWTNAARVAYRALTVYCTPGTDYRAARDCWISAASDLNPAWATNAAQAWSAVGVSALTVTPDSGRTFRGPVGGPFLPTPQSFSVSNTSPEAMAWTAAVAGAWSELSSTSGVLAGGGGTNVGVGLNAAANGLPQGIYTNWITFSNTVDSFWQRVPVLLRVNVPDYLTEVFDAADNDLDHTTLTFKPDGSPGFYAAYCEPAGAFPTDPAGGTPLALVDDGYLEVVLGGGGSVSFFGVSYSSLFVGSNGYLTFGSGDGRNDESLTTHFSLPRIGALLTDLDPSAGGTVSWKQLPDRVAVTFQDVPMWAEVNQSSLQFELFSNGIIRVTCLRMDADHGIAGLSRGLGVPDDFAESDLSAYPPDDDLQVLPGDGLSVAGHCRGTFAPTSMVYTLDNIGTGVVNWSATHTQSWVALSAVGGVLPPGGATQVTVSVSEVITNFLPGTYRDSVVFANADSGCAQVRTVTATLTASSRLILTPPSFCVTNQQGCSTNALLTIGNAAFADGSLAFTLGVRHLAYAPAPAAAQGVGLPDAGRDFSKAHPGVGYAKGRLLVRFAAGVSAAQRTATLAGLGGTAVKAFSIVPGLCLVKLGDGVAVGTALPRFNATPGILYAEPDYEQKALRTPNDARFSELWGMHNTGGAGKTPDADIDAPEAWDVATGSAGIVVGVIDTGVDYNHEDLSANLWRNLGEIPGNGVDDDGNGYVDDVYGINAITGSGNPLDDQGHGTHVAGTIGGVGNNGVGVAGVCWQVRIMALKFIGSNGSGYTSDAITCMEYGMAKGARVLSNSWGGGAYEQSLKDAIDAAGAAGIAFVAAAGNDGGSNNDTSPIYPASYTSANVIAVMSTTATDARSDFSNYGRQSVDLGAPGTSILSCQRNGGYVTNNGTSMATPHVAGACALLLSRNSMLTVAELKAALMATVDPTMEGQCVSGGRLNVARALSRVGPAWLTVTPNVVTNLSPGGSTNAVVVFNGVRPAGRYEGEIVIECNDPNLGATNVPCVMVVLPDPLGVTPAGGLASVGFVGGAYSFTPSNIIYTLTNLGDQAVSWTSAHAQAWVTVIPAGGTLDVGASTVVQVSINDAATGLVVGAYADAVTFSNVASGVVFARSVNVAVGERAFQFAFAGAAVGENAGLATVAVSRTDGSLGGVTVAFATSNGTATAGSDYVATNGTLTFGAGQLTNTFTITILDDALVEGGETILLRLGNPVGGWKLGVLSNATLVVTDDETPPVFNFKIVSLLTNNSHVVDHNALTGDDRGGIAASSSWVFYSGDSATARFQLGDLTGGASLGKLYDAWVSDLRSGEVYSLAGGKTPLGNSGGTATTLLKHDPTTGLATTNTVLLSMPIAVPANGGDVGIFSGYGRVLLHTGSRAYAIFLPGGAVVDLGEMASFNHMRTENWAYWGVAEYDGGTNYLVYVRGSSVIVRTAVPSGTTTTLATFVNLSDMACFTVSVPLNRWFFHHEFNSQFGGTAAESSEVIGYADATFQVSVPVNTSPAFVAVPTNRTIDELTTLVITNRGADAEGPPQTLVYALVDAPAGVAIDTNGVITWTPGETQGPDSHVITTVVSDNGTPSLSATSQFTVVVGEVNTAPTLALPGAQAVHALSPVEWSASASDADRPPNSLVYSRLTGPEGLVVSAAGKIAWTPTAAQVGTTNTVTVMVSDGGLPVLSDTADFSIAVHPALVVFPPNATGGVVNLLWSSISGKTYRVEYCGTLEPAVWTNLNAGVVATGATEAVACPLDGTVTQRFYRVVSP